jgi:hypothetical protein
MSSNLLDLNDRSEKKSDLRPFVFNFEANSFAI